MPITLHAHKCYRLGSIWLECKHNQTSKLRHKTHFSDCVRLHFICISIAHLCSHEYVAYFSVFPLGKGTEINLNSTLLTLFESNVTLHIMCFFVFIFAFLLLFLFGFFSDVFLSVGSCSKEKETGNSSFRLRCGECLCEHLI